MPKNYKPKPLRTTVPQAEWEIIDNSNLSLTIYTKAILNHSEKKTDL